ncbi:hypothetical protein [Sneathiella sp. HT1-7]|uniref:hypothetical protein n=1 Tax=Sneathiella sp. HT1-7 TaxID=2887192 RepID=UPI001D159E1D|nr:hypothetical protein [Sneathiella sp. HT1-7]MCC3304781.1 hypothetical protein [Sneathiella sp. HT1-7]
MISGKVFVSLMLAVLACISCSASDYKFRGASMDETTADGKPLVRLSVNNPSFSPDGRYFAFDFYEFSFVDQRTNRSRLAIGIYDLKSQAVNILKPPLNPEMGFGWHSPSFDPTGKKLTMVTVCITENCSDEIYGTQIGVFELDTNKFTWITDARQKTYNWDYLLSARGLRRTSWPKYGRSVVRGYPIFSSDGNRIYHVMSGGAKGSIVFWMQFNADYWLNELDLENSTGSHIASDESVLAYDHDAVIFKGDGRLSRSGDNRLIFSGTVALGPGYEELEARKPSAFFYSIESDELSVAFDKDNMPFDPRFPADRQYRIRSISSSFDGARIAALSGKKDIVYLWEKGKFRTLTTAADLGVDRVSQVSISSDGNQLVILPPQEPISPEDFAADIEHFWLLDLNSGKMKSLPLRSLLRRTIDSEKNRRENLGSPG